MERKSGMQTARFSAAGAFFTAVWVTCVNRVDPMSFVIFEGGGGGGGVWEGLRV